MNDKTVFDYIESNIRIIANIKICVIFGRHYWGLHVDINIYFSCIYIENGKGAVS